MPTALGRGEKDGSNAAPAGAARSQTQKLAYVCAAPKLDNQTIQLPLGGLGAIGAI